MADWVSYLEGLHRIGNGVYAYLQPDGSWGLNNAGAVVSRGQSLIVDALADNVRTRRMMKAVLEAEPGAGNIDAVIITHWHVDHRMGLAPLKGSRIIMAKACAEEVEAVPPKKWIEHIGKLKGHAKQMMDQNLGNKLDLEGVEHVPPTETFNGRLELMVGDIKIVAIETDGPTHTRSDTIIHIPSEEIVFAGDTLKPAAHPSLNYPYIDKLIKLYELFIELKARIYVPGHRALCDIDDVKEALDYLRFMKLEARKRYDAAQKPLEAAEDILNNLGRFSHYRSAEVLLPIVTMLYCEFEGDKNATARDLGNYSDYMKGRWSFRESMRQKYPDLPFHYL